MTSRNEALRVKIALAEEAVKTKEFELKDLMYSLRMTKGELGSMRCNLKDLEGELLRREGA